MLLEKEMAPTPFLLGESHGQRSPGGYSPRGREESDTTERLKTSNDTGLYTNCASWAPRLTLQAHGRALENCASWAPRLTLQTHGRALGTELICV